MASESDTLADAGTDNAQPSTNLDNPANLDFYDPEEDNVEPDELNGTEGEPDDNSSDDESQGEDEESESADDAKTETDNDDTENPDAESDTEKSETGDVEITLNDGSKVQLDELKSSYYRQADYTRDKQEVSNNRKSVAAQSDQIANTIDAFANFLAEQIPAEPDLGLSLTNPSDYTAQKAHYDAAIGQISALIEMGQKPKDVNKEISQSTSSETLAKENASLVMAFPQTSNEKGREAFFKDAFSGGRELGYSDAEMKGVTDHRLLGLAYWARKGMASEKNLAKANAKVKDLPPVTPVRRQKGVTGKGSNNHKAMGRLKNSGSIHDAVNIDFD